jgi:lipopolysaccharide export system protein LptA
VRRRPARFLVAALAATALACAGGLGRAQSGAARFGSVTIEAQHLMGTLGGPLECSKEVKITSGDMIVNCDRLKAWPSPDGKEVVRAEASGHVRINASYVAPDQSAWKVAGTADSATHDRKSGVSVLQGSLDLKATNLTTGAVVTVVADKLTYDAAAGQFQFERVGKPVRVVWEQPELTPQPAGSEASPSEDAP